MKVLLLKYNSDEQAIHCASARGLASTEEERIRLKRRSNKSGGFEIQKIGYFYKEDPNAESEDSPGILAFDGFWAFIRCDDDFSLDDYLEPVPDSIKPALVWDSIDGPIPDNLPQINLN